MTSDNTKTPVDIPFNYYHQNFCQVLNVVKRRYDDLLSQQELNFLRNFFNASVAAQCLYVRLSSRTKSFFRLSKLDYSEIPKLPEVAVELEELGLLSLNTKLGIEELISLFTKPELISLLSIVGGHKYSRAVLETYIIEESNPSTLPHLENADTIVGVLQEEHLPTFKLCFFGNLYQDLSEFVLRDLAIYQFENYSLDTLNRKFTSRTQIEQHLLYYTCSDLYDEATSEGINSIVALSESLPDPLPHDHSLIRRTSKLRNRLARELERQDANALALQLYRTSSSPPARERQARILMAEGEIDLSLLLCKELLQAPINEAEATFAQQFGQRHAKRHSRPWEYLEPIKPDFRQLCLRREKSVELDTAEHLAKIGECFYVENTLFSSMLGLTIWSSIFAPVQGAFSHPFQHRPDDFFDSDFQARRKEGIDAAFRLQHKNPASFKQQLFETYHAKQGIANPLVHWSSIDEELLVKALDRIPVEHWQLFFSRMLADLRNNCSGLPDLIFFPDTGGYELVEVKGPGDKLQNNQKRWLQFFHENEISCWVAQVSWQEGPTDA